MSDSPIKTLTDFLKKAMLGSIESEWANAGLLAVDGKMRAEIEHDGQPALAHGRSCFYCAACHCAHHQSGVVCGQGGLCEGEGGLNLQVTMSGMVTRVRFSYQETSAITHALHVLHDCPAGGDATLFF